MVEPSHELVDAIYRDKVLQARRMSPEEKLLAGPHLFDEACNGIRGAIRACFPKASEDDVQTLLKRVVQFAESCGLV